MKFVIDNWMLISVALMSGGMLLWPVIQGGAGGGLGAAKAVQLINRERGVVIDISEPAEYAQGHVGNARNVPLGQLEQRLPEVVKNKTVPVIFVCANGGRSQRAAGIAKKLGYDRAEALAGGLKSWKEANLPVEKA